MKQILLAALMILPASTLSAGVLFSENFEGGSLASNWSSNLHGAIVADPLNGSNNVLQFTSDQGGGDLFSNVISSASTYYLEFDYYFSSSVFNFGGGFVGVNSPGETWLLGDCGGCYGTYSNLLDGIAADSWQHVQLSFPASDVGPGPMVLKLEQYQGPAGNAYFDNIVIRDDGFTSPAPEPSTGILFAIGAGLTAFARRRRAARD